MNAVKIGLYLGVGIISGLLIPAISRRTILYKCRKLKRDPPEFILPRHYAILIAALNALLFAAAGWLMPVPQASLVCLFVCLAIVSTIVDVFIRIICNEIVLLILIAGVVYRIIGGDLYALLGSLAALGVVVIVFGSAALITKKLTKQTGVGAGDIKLAVAIAVTVGISGVFYFLGGVAVAIGAYCILGLTYHFLSRKSTFAMGGHIMFGFLAALFLPYILT